MLHWWRYIAARRNQTCWIYLSLVFSHLMEYSTALKRNQNVLTTLHHSCTHSEGRARCPQQCLGWWREFFIKCTNWPETRQAAGLADSPPLVEATHRLWLLGVTVCCVHLVNGLRSLLGQERWIWQNRGGFTEIQEGVQHHCEKVRTRKAFSMTENRSTRVLQGCYMGELRKYFCKTCTPPHTARNRDVRELYPRNKEWRFRTFNKTLISSTKENPTWKF